jgi:hypothetical protein
MRGAVWSRTGGVDRAAGHGQPCGRGSGRLVVVVDQLGHERGHGVGIEGFAPHLVTKIRPPVWSRLTRRRGAGIHKDCFSAEGADVDANWICGGSIFPIGEENSLGWTRCRPSDEFSIRPT